MLADNSLIHDIKTIIAQSREQAVRAVNHERTVMYWHIGQRIFEEEQRGKERADYGAYLVQMIAERLQPEFGSGFSKRQIERCRQFYRAFPIASALRTQLSWTQYKMLLSIDNEDKREFYIAESVKNNWTSRQLERQINSQLYERLQPEFGNAFPSGRLSAIASFTSSSRLRPQCGRNREDEVLHTKIF